MSQSHTVIHYPVKMLLAGLLAGFFSLIYRRLLEIAEFLLTVVYARGETDYRVVAIWGVVLLLIAYQTARIVAWNPAIVSGGMADTLAVYRLNAPHSWFKNVVANLAGGALSLLGGASIGTETPIVQLGASAANGVSYYYPPENENVRRDVMAVGAGAGFTVGFSAPVAGLLFVLWFVHERKDLRFWICTAFALALSYLMASAFYGTGPFFAWPEIEPSNEWICSWPVAAGALLIGVTAALFGFVYKRIFLKLKRDVDWLRAKLHLSRFWFFLIVFLIAGVSTFLLPLSVGSGIYMTGIFPLTLPLAFLLLLFAVKFICSMIAPASGLPGGLMFPLLALGGLAGRIFAEVMVMSGGALTPEESMAFVLAGMAALFAVVTDMPLIAVILLWETTHLTGMLPAILIAVAAATLICRICGMRSVYEILYANLRKTRRYLNASVR